MKITVTQIVDPNHKAVPIICQWLQTWWGEAEAFSQEKMESYVKHSLCSTRIPQTFLMEVDGIPAGMFQFSMTDIDVRPDIYPWLINVFIEPKFRGVGLFHLLMGYMHDAAKNVGVEELYLFTKHEGLYEKYGWVLVEQFQTFLNSDETQNLYKLSLN